MNETKRPGHGDDRPDELLAIERDLKAVLDRVSALARKNPNPPSDPDRP